MNLILFFGYLAGFLTTVSLIPQVIKMWQTKSADDFSLAMLLTWCMGVLCWVIYGILTDAEPIILWNISTLLLAGAILSMKLKFKNKINKYSSKVLSKKTKKRYYRIGVCEKYLVGCLYC